MKFKEWEELGQKNGWKIHPKRRAIWLLRLPIVRHIRAGWYKWRLMKHVAMHRAIGTGFFPSDYDRWVISAIRYGKF